MTPERKIQQEIMGFLRSIGIMCWINESQGTYDPVRKTFRKNNNPYKMRGVSDILGLVPYYTEDTKASLGRFLAIEVKSDKGRLTDEQRIFLAKINQEGGIAFVARSVEQCANQLLTFFPHNQKLKQFAKDYVQSNGVDH